MAEKLEHETAAETAEQPPLTLAEHRQGVSGLIALVGGGGAPTWLCWRCRATVSLAEHGRQCPKCGHQLVRQPEDVAEQARFRRARRIGQLGRAWDSVPRGFRWARFGDTLSARVTPQEAVLAAERALHALRDDGSSVLLIGPSGSGKTSLGCAIVRALIDKAKKLVDREKPGADYELAAGAMFVTAYNLAKAAVYSPLGRIPEIVRQSLGATVLVLDDLGSDIEIYRQSATSVREVLHERHAERRPTVVTTFLRRDDLVAHYGDGIARRLGEGSVIVLGDTR